MNMLYMRETNKSIDQVGAALERAAKERQFGIMTIHNLRETMQKKGIEFNRDLRIYEICNPQQAKRVLEAEPNISTALPCRISVYRADGKTKLATIRPTVQLGMFERKDLEQIAKEVEDVIIAVMDEAAKEGS
jgi:uncharacterized protein (DUF302 family)